MQYFFNQVLEEIVERGAIRATKYISPKLIVRGVLKTYRAFGRKPRKDHNREITLTIGKPNYIERDFIKLCQKAKEPFPVKRIQLRFYNPKSKRIEVKK